MHGWHDTAVSAAAAANDDDDEDAACHTVKTSSLRFCCRSVLLCFVRTEGSKSCVPR